MIRNEQKKEKEEIKKEEIREKIKQNEDESETLPDEVDNLIKCYKQLTINYLHNEEVISKQTIDNLTSEYLSGCLLNGDNHLYFSRLKFTLKSKLLELERKIAAQPKIEKIPQSRSNNLKKTPQDRFISITEQSGPFCEGEEDDDLQQALALSLSDNKENVVSNEIQQNNDVSDQKTDRDEPEVSLHGLKKSKSIRNFGQYFAKNGFIGETNKFAMTEKEQFEYAIQQSMLPEDKPDNMNNGW